MHEILTSDVIPDVGHYGALERSFDFSKFPNLQEVTLISRTASSTHGGLPWVPMALSTLKPTTSPRLSTIRLDFTCLSNFGQSAETLIEDMGDDLRRAADEVLRIDCEFEGAVDFTTLRDSKFKMALDKLNVRFHFVSGKDHIVTLIQFCSSPTDPSTTAVEMESVIDSPICLFRNSATLNR